jgi:hypothetical protein
MGAVALQADITPIFARTIRKFLVRLVYYQGEIIENAAQRDITIAVKIIYSY